MKVCTPAYNLLIITLLVASTQAIDLPHCQTTDFYRTLPLVANESYIMDLDSFFGGYNLDYSVKAAPAIQKYITLKDK